jgi:hypothetical protein
MFFFTLLPFFWAGWLFSNPFVRYNYEQLSLAAAAYTRQ